ncbi:hypothetical protein Dsin_012002 [Dipteronia sinensis]|uniref:HAT C-terminal dimerisation domain-containing protein n=1 Tax=Dipteronia sinensis TaxID=43782 RepID=A0AAE0E825_9ROSI|nr:hypothetical protein Dsin_012002 [Dipteronia sinensis]
MSCSFDPSSLLLVSTLFLKEGLPSRSLPEIKRKAVKKEKEQEANITSSTNNNNNNTTLVDDHIGQKVMQGVWWTKMSMADELPDRRRTEETDSGRNRDVVRDTDKRMDRGTGSGQFQVTVVVVVVLSRLSKIARDVLAIPVSPVTSESAFSTGGRILSSCRSRLHAHTTEALMCTQNWIWAQRRDEILRGEVMDEDDE